MRVAGDRNYAFVGTRSRRIDDDVSSGIFTNAIYAFAAFSDNRSGQVFRNRHLRCLRRTTLAVTLKKKKKLLELQMRKNYDVLDLASSADRADHVPFPDSSAAYRNHPCKEKKLSSISNSEITNLTRTDLDDSDHQAVLRAYSFVLAAACI